MSELHEKDNTNGWTEYGKLVLSELERLQVDQDKANIRITLTREKDLPDLSTKIATLEKDFNAKVAALEKDILGLQIKASIYGGLAGSILASLIAAAISHFTKG